MNIFSFTAHFGTEEECRFHFKTQRDKEGVICKKCDHDWLYENTYLYFFTKDMKWNFTSLPKDQVREQWTPGR